MHSNHRKKSAAFPPSCCVGYMHGTSAAVCAWRESQTSLRVPSISPPSCCVVRGTERWQRFVHGENRKLPCGFPRRVASSSGVTERWQRFVHRENRKLHRDFSGKSPDLGTHLQDGNVDNDFSCHIQNSESQETKKET